MRKDSAPLDATVGIGVNLQEAQLLSVVKGGRGCSAFEMYSVQFDTYLSIKSYQPNNKHLFFVDPSNSNPTPIGLQCIPAIQPIEQLEETRSPSRDMLLSVCSRCLGATQVDSLASNDEILPRGAASHPLFLVGVLKRAFKASI